MSYIEHEAKHCKILWSSHIKDVCLYTVLYNQAITALFNVWTYCVTIYMYWYCSNLDIERQVPLYIYIYIYIYVPIRPSICRFNMTTFSSVSMQGFCLKKRPTSLQDHLIGPRFSKYDDRGSEFWSSIIGNNYILRVDIMCATKSLIYLITCKRCDTQHCMSNYPTCVSHNHRFDMSNFMNPNLFVISCYVFQ